MPVSSNENNHVYVAAKRLICHYSYTRIRTEWFKTFSVYKRYTHSYIIYILYTECETLALRISYHISLIQHHLTSVRNVRMRVHVHAIFSPADDAHGV